MGDSGIESKLARGSLLVAFACLLGACSGTVDATAPGPSDGDAGLTSSCPALPASMTGSPATIADAIDMANALYAERPGSLSLDCFIERLARPLPLLGVVSTFSLQPAVNKDSPRIFIFSGSLVMSVIPTGEGAPYLELAQYTSPVRSIKAQVIFPLTAPVPPAEPYDSIRSGNGTICGGCHSDERPAAQVTLTAAFESGVFQPRPEDVVTVPYMQQQAATCDHQQEPMRCEMFDALFGHGDVSMGAFSPSAPTIFE